MATFKAFYTLNTLFVSPSVPANVLVALGVPTTSVLDVSWDIAVAGSFPIAGYEVWRDGSFLIDVGNVLTYEDTGLTDNTTYGYQVLSYNTNANKSALSTVVNGTTDVAIPLTPTGLTVSAPTLDSLTINFNTSVDATGYRIYRDGALVKDQATNAQYVDSGLTDSTTYTYTVSAYNTTGESTQSAGVSGTTTIVGSLELIIAVPLNFTTTIDFDVWGTIDYSLDGGSTWSGTVTGAPYNISGVPSGNVLVNNIGSDITQISFSSKDFFSAITIIEPTGSITTARLMFFGCTDLTSLDVTNFNTSSVTDMVYMFRTCYTLAPLDVTNFDTSSVTTMSGMFWDCRRITSLDISTLDTSSVTDMSLMFYKCQKLASIDLTNLNVSSVTTMSSMFFSCDSLASIDLTNLNTSSLTVMRAIFENCKKLTSIGLIGLDTSSVKDMVNMFYNCEALTSLDLTSFDTSSVTSMKAMFFSCLGLTSLDLTSFDTSSVTDMVTMFHNCINLICITNIDSTAITETGQMFNLADALTNPNASEQTQIEAGFNYVNANPCP